MSDEHEARATNFNGCDHDTWVVCGGCKRLAAEFAAVERETEERTVKAIVAWLRERVRQAGEVEYPLGFQKDMVIVTRACADAIERGDWRK